MARALARERGDEGLLDVAVRFPAHLHRQGVGHGAVRVAAGPECVVAAQGHQGPAGVNEVLQVL